ncbi:MAG: 50S ribosomal protein L21 [Myxococcales bacterium]
MYAVIRTGGKQYRVAEGQWVDVEKLPYEVGADVQFDEVLLIADDGSTTVGRPFVAGAKVTGKVIRQDRAKKILVFKYRRRKNYRLRRGHRQYYTRVQITGVHNG